MLRAEKKDGQKVGDLIFKLRKLNNESVTSKIKADY